MGDNRVAVDLDTWVKEEKARIDSFAKFYRDQREQADRKSNWPLRMPAGEWDEQYRMYEK